jgi:hypothetical protein
MKVFWKGGVGIYPILETLEVKIPCLLEVSEVTKVLIVRVERYDVERKVVVVDEVVVLVLGKNSMVVVGRIVVDGASEAGNPEESKIEEAGNSVVNGMTDNGLVGIGTPRTNVEETKEVIGAATSDSAITLLEDRLG